MATEKPIYWDYRDQAHRNAFALAIAPMVTALSRSHPFSKEDGITYMQALRFVPTAIFVEACERALRVFTWFPSPAQLLTLCADLVDEKRAAAVKGLLPEDCVDCGGARWVEVLQDGVTRMDRCGCHRRAMQRLAEIGAPVERPALPASETSHD